MQDILIHARDYHGHTTACEFGVRLAATLGASVTAVYACPHPMYFSPVVYPSAITAFMENALELVKNAVQARPAFEQWAASLGVPKAEWLVAQGIASDALLQAATRHDLLVLDHPTIDQGSPWDIPGLILRAGVPCIVLPQAEAMPERQIQRVALAWNGSPEAMRAIHAARPLLRGRQVLLLWGAAERDVDHGVEWDPSFHILEYLQRHGVEVEEHMIAARHDEVGTALLDAATKFGADLLVMGAYGRNRFSEWWLGGATRHVLAWADIPVLFRH
ncbi:MAG: universal stress protein [Xanthomonadaceae bacterium]|jgi:nucleotide-binding universal stress UspA family protein|nr:universal stress protein [Xanthomonadaceae bacterium]MDE2317359.1 universal stress protein [Xanthomonadaceae bacterium]